jgi:hypothetical protein
MLEHDPALDGSHERYARVLSAIECREDHHSHLSPPAQKFYRFAALEYIEEQA